MGKGSDSSSNNRIATVLASVITAAWGTSFLVDIVVKDYDPSPSVHALMMMVAGAVFGEGLLKTQKSGSENTKDDEDDQRTRRKR